MKPEAAMPLDYTGERMVPEKSEPNVFWEHIYRYRFAASFAAGKEVLDIACGEGYGTAALIQAGAKSVLGMDISEESCSHARRKYGIDARIGNAEQIALPDGSVDLVVSFETIEHVPHPELFVKECRRVLRSDGTLIVSTPNKSVYREYGNAANPFHCSEMNKVEFLGLLGCDFRCEAIYDQSREYVPLAAIDPFLRRISDRLAFRVRVAALWLYARQLRKPVPEAFRHDVVNTILTPSRKISHWVDPYTVRPHCDSSAAHPTYLIAVARPL
jgi:ubiquinone/menaquinone biosynthesis C-methylase UbiE